MNPFRSNQLAFPKPFSVYHVKLSVTTLKKDLEKLNAIGI